MTSEKHCFVIMPFSETSADHTALYWDNFFFSFIKPIVEKVGYTCKRSSAEIGNIMKAIVNELINSDVVLAVLTDFNPNVWYELGARHSLKNGTIMMIERGQKLPFDISQYGIIEYDDKIAGAAIFEENLRKVLNKFESQKIPDSPVRDFLNEYGKNSFKQNEERMQKTYEEKLEKIYQFIQGLQQDKAVAPSKAKDEYMLKEVSVLWIDDYPSNNQSIIDVYGLQGVRFDLAISTSQALNFLASRNYNLIISDMSRGTERDAGIKLLQEIKFRIATPPPFFIFAGSKAVETFGETAYREGALLVTDSVRELTLKMNDILKKSSK